MFEVQSIDYKLEIALTIDRTIHQWNEYIHSVLNTEGVHWFFIRWLNQKYEGLSKDRYNQRENIASIIRRTDHWLGMSIDDRIDQWWEKPEVVKSENHIRLASSSGDIAHFIRGVSSPWKILFHFNKTKSDWIEMIEALEFDHNERKCPVESKNNISFSCFHSREERRILAVWMYRSFDWRVFEREQ